MTRGDHPDYSVVERPEDRTSIPIERLRELREWFSKAPYRSDRRIALIDDAHLMKIEAQNSLLKLLEEPPGRGLLLLVTPEPGRLLETVISRLQRIWFGPLPDEVGIDLLQRVGEIDVDDSELRRAWGLAEGSVGRALKLLGDEGLTAACAAAYGLFDRKTMPFAWAQDLAGGRATTTAARQAQRQVIERTLEVAVSFARERLRSSLTGAVPVMSRDLDAAWPASATLWESVVTDVMRAIVRLRGMVTPRLTLEALKISCTRHLAVARKAARTAIPGR